MVFSSSLCSASETDYSLSDYVKFVKGIHLKRLPGKSIKTIHRFIPVHRNNEAMKQ